MADDGLPVVEMDARGSMQLVLAKARLQSAKLTSNHVPEAISVLLMLMRESKRPQVQLQAARAILATATTDLFSGTEVLEAATKEPAVKVVVVERGGLEREIDARLGLKLVRGDGK